MLLSIRRLAAAALVAAVAPAAVDAQGPARITVRGRVLPGVAPVVRDGRVLLPAQPIARALDATVEVTPPAGVVRVIRQDGAVAEFDPVLRQVSESGVVVLALPEGAVMPAADLGGPLLLPAEVVAPLFDVSVVFDEAGGEIRVRPAAPQPAATGTSAGRARLEFDRGEYAIGVTTQDSRAARTLSGRVDGIYGPARLSLVTQVAGSGSGPTTLRTSTAVVETSRLRFAAGDVAAGAELPLLATRARGGVLQAATSRGVLTVFGGRTPASALPAAAVTTRPSDSATAGAWWSFDRKRASGATLAGGAGLTWTDGETGGTLALSDSFRVATQTSHVQTDVAVTRSGDAAGLGLDVAAWRRVRPSVAIDGRVAYASDGYAPASSAWLRGPLALASGSVSWQPGPRFAGSLTTTQSSSAAGRATSFAAAGSLQGSGRWPSVSANTTASFQPSQTSSFTRVNVEKTVGGWRTFTAVSLASSGTLVAPFAGVGDDVESRADWRQFHQTSFTAGVARRLSALGGIQAWHTMAAGGSSGGFDGNLQLRTWLSLAGGVGFSRDEAELAVLPRFSAQVGLGGERMLQASWTPGPRGSQLQLLLVDRFSRRRGADAASLPMAIRRTLGRASGTVFEDANGDGVFTPGADRPLRDVVVIADGRDYSRTDAGGRFRFDALDAGPHALTIDFTTVRADLTLMEPPVRRFSIVAGAEAVIDVSAARSGRLRGEAWLDDNENGVRDEREAPVAFARVYTPSGGDTITDERGAFVLADLPPGETTVLIDHKTLPATLQAPTPVRAVVRAGAESGPVRIPVVPRTVVVK